MFAMVSKLSVVLLAGPRPVLDIVGAQLCQQQTSQAWMQQSPLRFAWNRE